MTDDVLMGALQGTLPTEASGSDPETARLRRLIREELAVWSKQQQTIGWVTGLDPLTVRLKTGGDVQVSLKNASMALALNQKVSLIHTGAGYMITGLSAGPQDGQTIDHEHQIGDHQHAEADITDIGTHSHGDPAMEVIATYDGNTSDTTFAFSSIPQTFTHLRMIGRLSHTNSVATGLVEGRLRFNSDTGTNYHYVNWNSTGVIDVAATMSNNQDRIFIDIGTNTHVDLTVYNYRANSSFVTFSLHSSGVYGTTTASNFKQRLYGGRYNKASAGTALDDIRIFQTGGDTYEVTTKVTLYGMR